MAFNSFVGDHPELAVTTGYDSEAEEFELLEAVANSELGPEALGALPVQEFAELELESILA
jgi:hypothetical protein